MSKKYSVELRSGKKVLVETEVNPPTPPTQKELFEIRTLEYMHATKLVYDNVQCEKFIVHHFDGTLATHKINTRFKGSRADIIHVLCENCKNEFVEKVGGDDELTPITNRGSKNN